jgi:hypothetical protein
VSDLPGIGDKIRIIEEGIVEDIRKDVPRYGITRLRVRRPNGRSSFFYFKPEMSAKVEILEKAEALEDGAVYLDSTGDLVRWDAGVGCFWEIDRYSDEETRREKTWASRPLRKISL